MKSREQIGETAGSASVWTRYGRFLLIVAAGFFFCAIWILPAQAESDPVCSDCHGDIDTAASVHNVIECVACHRNVAESSHPVGPLEPLDGSAVCEACHSEAVGAVARSVHAGRLDCGNCHGPPHAISGSKTPASPIFRLRQADTCSGCHGSRYLTYRDTFHGRATDLGYVEAAACTDCHGAHRILPAGDPESTIHFENLSETCGACHGSVGAGFLSFKPHLDPRNSEEAGPVYWIWLGMTILLAGVFGFFGLHTLLWLQRSIVGLARGEYPPEAPHETAYVRRFDSSDIWLHVVIVLSFLTLAATGLPLKFHYTGWAKDLSALLGGVEVSGWLHRAAAVVTFGYGAYHFGSLARSVVLNRDFGLLWGRRSMVPGPKDVLDVLENFRYFFYLGPRPSMDRWSYWEKFDYLAVFWGIPIIGFSGLMLWFPDFFTRFLPGWVLNAAFIIHSDEALLAIGFIFLFHFFHNHMRPENFPMDPAIFTGSVPLSRFKRERADEYRRLSETGEIESRLVAPPSAGRVAAAYTFGFVTLGIGVILLIAMLWAFFVY